MENHGNFKILTSCTICHTRLDKENFSLVSKRDPGLTFHVTCPKCKAATLVSLSAGQGGFMGVGVMTDLDKSEAGEKLNFSLISADEIIEIYETIKEIK